jgi:hypothetical protein
MLMIIRKRKISLLPPRGEAEEEEEQPLGGDSQVENQRKICHTSKVMCVDSFDTLLANAPKLRRDLVKEGEEKILQPQQKLKTMKRKKSNSWLPQLESFLECLRTNTLCSWIQRTEPGQVGT